LGIAVVLTLLGVLLFSKAVVEAIDASWGRAIAAFLVGVVLEVLAFNFYAAAARRG
jgi:hypothetical protein